MFFPKMLCLFSFEFLNIDFLPLILFSDALVKKNCIDENNLKVKNVIVYDVVCLSKHGIFIVPA